MPGEAEVKYLDGDFRVVRPGTFVRCAVTGVAIPLEELRYWSVDLQEAYATPEAVLQRHAGAYARKSWALTRPTATFSTARFNTFKTISRNASASSTSEPHRQRVRAGGRAPAAARSPASRARSFSVVSNIEVRGVGARDESVRLCRRVAVMVGKACAFGDRDAGFGEGCEEFLRIADAGKGQNAAPAERGDGRWIGFETSHGRSRARAGARSPHTVVAPSDGPTTTHRMRARDLRLQRRPQRTRRE